MEASAPGYDDTSKREEPRLTRDEYDRIAHPSSALGVAGVAVLLAAAVESPWGRATTGVMPWWIAGISAVWILASPVGTHLLSTYESFTAPGSIQRAIETHATIVYCAAFGAVSRLDASPTYAFLFAAVINLGWMFAHRSPAALLAAALVPPALRWCAVPDASALSLMVALGCGLATSLGIVAWGRRCEREHELFVAAELERSRLAAEREGSQRLQAAMALHDGLSGAVLVLESRLADARAFDDGLREAVRIILARVSALLDGHAAHRLETLPVELPAIASWTGARCVVSLDDRITELSDGERRDLSNLLWEATMNALRAGAAELEARVELTADRVALICTGRAVGRVQPDPFSTRTGPPRTGRGLRYAASRAGARGGAARLDRDGTFVASWPRGPRPSSDRWVFVVTLAGIGVASIALALAQGQAGPLWLTALGATAAASAFGEQARGAARARRELDALEEEALVMEERAVLGPALELLGPGATALAAAAASSSLPGVRAAARSLAEGIGAALIALDTA